jgi:hypothetical protein
MPTNPYFRYNVQSEQDLYENLVIESIGMNGQDVYYLPRTIVNEDRILGDDIPSKFDNAYIIEVYIESVDGFGGEGTLFSKFGVEIRDQATFIVSRRRWAEAVSSLDNNISGDLPEEGDLIYLPLSKSLFQIMHVERENPFYQLSNLNVVRLECELFEYNEEELDTGIEEIDEIQQVGFGLLVTLDSATAIPPTVDDTLTQVLSDGTIITGEILEWDSDLTQIRIGQIGASDGEFHLFTTGTILSSSNTAGVYTPIAVTEDINKAIHHNEAFDSDVDIFLDFSENNPFGDPQ